MSWATLSFQPQQSIPLCSYLIILVREFVPVPKVLCPRYLVRCFATLYVCTRCRILFRHTTRVFEILGPIYASGLWGDRASLAAHCHHQTNPTRRIFPYYHVDAVPYRLPPLLSALRMVIFGTLRENHMSARIQCLSSLLRVLDHLHFSNIPFRANSDREFQSLFQEHGQHHPRLFSNPRVQARRHSGFSPSIGLDPRQTVILVDYPQMTVKPKDNPR